MQKFGIRFCSRAFNDRAQSYMYIIIKRQVSECVQSAFMYFRQRISVELEIKIYEFQIRLILLLSRTWATPAGQLVIKYINKYNRYNLNE